MGGGDKISHYLEAQVVTEMLSSADTLHFWVIPGADEKHRLEKARMFPEGYHYRSSPTEDAFVEALDEELGCATSVVNWGGSFPPELARETIPELATNLCIQNQSSSAYFRNHPLKPPFQLCSQARPGKPLPRVVTAAYIRRWKPAVIKVSVKHCHYDQKVQCSIDPPFSYFLWSVSHATYIH